MSSTAKKVLFAALALLLIVLITGGILLSLIFRDDNEGLSAEPSVDLLTKGVVAAGTGKEVEIGQDELNGFLAYLFTQKKQEEKAFQMDGLYLTMGQKEGETGIYLPCTYEGRHIGVTARAIVTFDAVRQAFCIQIEKCKAGRLSVPVSWALGFAEKHLPQGVTREGNSLWVDASKFSLYIGELGSALRIEGFRIQGGGLHLQTTGVMESLQRYIKEKLGGVLGDSELLNELVDGLGGKLSDFLSGLQNEKENAK